MNTLAISQPASFEELHAAFDRRIDALESPPRGAPAKAIAGGFLEVHADVEPFVGSLKRRMLTSAFPWTDEERAQAQWIYAVNHRLARLAHGATESIARVDPAATLVLAAHTLFYMGESVKCEIAVGAQKPHDYAGLHAIMKWAISTRSERAVVRLRLEDEPVDCTLEGLYFRALLLADFAGGNLNCKQIEILDAWMRMWMPALKSVRVAPPGSPRRADLDSDAGLRRGPRADGGPSLYLPQAPIEKAYRFVIEAFHQGRILPEKGLAKEFRIEEHVAVLDLIRAALARSRVEYVARQDRRPTSTIVEVFVGVSEIAKATFSTGSTHPAMQTVHAISTGARQKDSYPLDSIFEPRRRLLQLVDVSESGLGLEGIHTPCDEIALGDILAVKLGPGAAVTLGKVVRRIPVAAHGGCNFGVRILSKVAQRVTVSPEPDAKNPDAFPIVFVPGEDQTGRHDGFLVSEREFTEAGPLRMKLGETVVRLRFNRVRDRGRGWILAGFEILDSRAASQ